MIRDKYLHKCNKANLSRIQLCNNGKLPKRIEYILEWNLLEKSVKRPYCFHPAVVLHIFALYDLLSPRTSFYKKSKTNIKSKPNLTNDYFT